MRIEDDFVEKVRNTVDIVDLISGYVRLKKRGKNHTALCPFHNEKTPSFSVSSSKQIFKCFGCGVGGDAFSFIQEIEKLSFPEAVRFVGERYGLSVPQSRPEDREKLERKRRLLGILADADRFFQQSLREHPPPRKYLESRRIQADTIATFGIGYAPGGSRLLSHLKGRGYSEKEIEAVGLINPGRDSGFYDKFRDRVMFPIRNLSGKVIAFGGRILGDGHPKYLNSPETPLYSKSQHLFALDVTREPVRKQDFAVLVEGYFDCVVPYQCGVQNIVASLGTSLTESQAKLLGRYTRQIVINFDPDSAGLRAALRSVDIFLEHGFHINVLRLPEGEDPDTFILSEGRQAYLEALKNSLPFLDFLLEYFVSEQRDPQSPKGKQEIVDRILPYLRRLPDRIERAEYASKISSRLRINEAVLLRELNRFRKPRGKVRRERPAGLPLQLTLAERNLLCGLLEEESRDFLFEITDSELLSGLPSERLFRQIWKVKNQNEEIRISNLRGGLKPEDQDLLDRLALRSGDFELTEEVLLSSVEAVQDLQLERLSRQIQEEIAREEREGMASTKLDELLRKKESIQRQRQRARSEER